MSYSYQGTWDANQATLKQRRRQRRLAIATYAFIALAVGSGVQHYLSQEEVRTAIIVFAKTIMGS